MKNIFLLALLFVFCKTAQANIILSSFSVNNVSSDNKLTVNDSQLPTDIEFKFTLFNYGDQYYPRYCYVTLLYTESPENNNYDNHSSTIEISSTKHVIKSDFIANGTVYQSGWLSAVLPAFKSSGKIVIRYKYFNSAQNQDVSWYSTVTYGINAPNYVSPNELSKIQSMGFSTAGITNFSSAHYLVEGDVMLSKAYVSNWTTSTPASQVTTYNINILKPSFLWQIGGPWETAFFRAIHAWNSMPNCNIKLHAIDESTNIYADARPIDISLVSQSNLSSRPVISSFPIGDGKPGSQILINPNFRYPGTNSTPTIEQATWNLVQAIGHTLGFKHVIGTGTEASVMRINTSTSSYSSQLTAPLDANPINAIYPLDANSILTPTVMGVSTKSHMEGNGFSISYSETGVTYSWRVVGINGTVWDRSYGEDYTSILPELYLPIGHYQIICTITGGKFGVNPVTATKDISVY